jgi:uncharacterized membrane protein YeaQ/YmgE (transglycosylase-associated protein family)
MLLEMSTNQWITSFSFACALAFLCGYIADRIMGFDGFGVIGNWLLILTGSYAAMLAYNQFGYRIEWYPLYSLAIAFGGGTALLLTLSAMKSATNT